MTEKTLEEVMDGRVTLTLLYVMLEDMRQEINAVRKTLGNHYEMMNRLDRQIHIVQDEVRHVVEVIQR